MARFLHRAKEALGCANRPGPFSGLFLTSAGHLGLAHASATPALRDLLTPGAFLLDATHSLGAVALRRLVNTGEENRNLREAFFPEELARAEAQCDAKRLETLRLLRALIDAEDGRFEDALDDLARLATGSPDRYPARLCVAVFCNLLGRVDEADRWLAGIPAEPSPCEHFMYNLAFVAAALGGAPGTVAGSRGRVVSAALQIINMCVSAGQMSAFETIITGLLKHAARRRCKDLPLNHGERALTLKLSGSVPWVPKFFVLKASQALLSAVVLRAHPLSSERVSAAVRIAERYLARAVEEGDAAAASDLRLLLAFLAARDSRFDDALARYQEVARDDPSDPRPHLLASTICLFVRRLEEAEKWLASYKRLRPESSFPHCSELMTLMEEEELMTLMEELLVALAIASPVAFDVHCPVLMRLIVPAAGSMVDAALVSALRTKNMSVGEWMEVWAARAFLHAGMWSALKKWEVKDGGTGSGTTTEE